MAQRQGMSVRQGALGMLEAGLGHRFARPGLLEQALRHRSAAHEQRVPSFERLEFLGDAALSHAVAALLFARWPDASEGELTRARAALVREASLAGLAERLGLPAALELGSGLREGSVGPAAARGCARGRARGTPARRRLALVSRRGQPSGLAAPRHARPCPAGTGGAQSTLQELAQKQGLPLPVYREVETRGPAHRRVYVYEVEFGGRVLARGEGPSKKAAQQEAARRALPRLEGTEA